MNPDAVGLHVNDGIRGPSIRTSDGGLLYICDPDPAEIRPRVLAHSLSQLCRYTGHTREFYSVAQHCVIVSRIVPPELAMAGLMHDASEAFIGDLSRPLKVVLEDLAPGIVQGIEDAIHAAIAERFGFDFPHDPLVKVGDNVALATELRDLMEGASENITGLPDPLPERIVPWAPATTRFLWLKRFKDLGGVL